MTETAAEQVCPECGGSFRPKRRGRPSVYCRPACRQRAWALRQAAARLVEHGLLVAGHDHDPDHDPETGSQQHTGYETESAYDSEYGTDREPEAPDEAGYLTGPEPAFAPVAAPHPGLGAMPTDARGWARLLSALTGQLADPDSELTRRPWEHLRLYDALGRSLTALDAATPGGLAWLERHES